MAKACLNFDWTFHLGDVEHAWQPDFCDNSWRKVDLPHDWSIEGSCDRNCPAGPRGGFLPTGIGWYRKTLEVQPSWSGKQVFIEFDGIYRNSEVWINGKSLGIRPNGYIGFEYDLTPYLRAGLNMIAVRVDHTLAPSGRWYTGSGIYRHVWLNVKDPVHIAHWGTYAITSEITKAAAATFIRTAVVNHEASDRQVTVSCRILDDLHRSVGAAETSGTLPAGEEAEFTVNMKVEHPRLWSVDDPYLYTLQTRIYKDGELADEEAMQIGIRTFSFDAETGFSLNGRSMKLQGVCQHEDAGPVGTAVPDKVLERRLQLLKEMGCNAIRTAHHPLSPLFYDLCDRIGFLVIDEAFDGWDKPKAEHDYGRYFMQWWQTDLRDMMRRDRNHPCVILWSVGNEVSGKTDERTREIQNFVHAYEPTRPVTCGRGEEGIFDVQGFNGRGGQPGVLEQVHAAYPERKIILTEEPHTFQTRGFYRTQTWWRDKDQPREEVANLAEEEIFFDGALQYNSSYDNSGVRTSARDSWRRTRDLPFVGGEFRWTGFDYLGESFGWPARMANFGILDLCGFPKDHYYFYQSQWTTRPMVHLLPHWTHPGKEGVVIPVWAYSNCDSVELLLNGQSFGEQETAGRMHLSWDVPYAPGVLEAVARIGGKITVRKRIATASDPVGILLSEDNRRMEANGKDISHVAFDIVDREGNPVPGADNNVRFHIEGPARNIGMENGDPLDLTPAKSVSRKAFYGKGMGIVQSTCEQGDIEVTAVGILGNRWFENTSRVTIGISRIALRGDLRPRLFEIYYTLDGSEPDRQSLKYDSSFRVLDTCTIRAVVFSGEEVIMDIQSEFTKGVREKVIDLTHGNAKPTEGARPTGPFDNHVIGQWDYREQLLYFEADGTVRRKAAYGGKLELVGDWWYDFPADPFEQPDYAGTGEIWWNGGKRSRIQLADQRAEQLIVESHGQSMRFSKVLGADRASSSEV
jgi:beta-galactosidase